MNLIIKQTKKIVMKQTLIFTITLLFLMCAKEPTEILETSKFYQGQELTLEQAKNIGLTISGEYMMSGDRKPSKARTVTNWIKWSWRYQNTGFDYYYKSPSGSWIYHGYYSGNHSIPLPENLTHYTCLEDGQPWIDWEALWAFGYHNTNGSMSYKDNAQGCWTPYVFLTWSNDHLKFRMYPTGVTSSCTIKRIRNYHCYTGPKGDPIEQ